MEFSVANRDTIEQHPAFQRASLLPALGKQAVARLDRGKPVIAATAIGLVWIDT